MSLAYIPPSAIKRAPSRRQGLGQIDRDLPERYLAVLQHEMTGKADHAKYIGSLNAFFAAIRRHGWDDTLPATAAFYPEDYPKASPQRLPRAVAEHVMAQVEDPANLGLWDNPAYRLVTLSLIRCGLRITGAIRLPFDCLISDSNGAPYLRYLNHKMNREALIPADEQLVHQIHDQQARVTGRYPGYTPSPTCAARSRNCATPPRRPAPRCPHASGPAIPPSAPGSPPPSSATASSPRKTPASGGSWPAPSATSDQHGSNPVTINPAETDTITLRPSRRKHRPRRDAAGHSLG